MIKSTRLPWLGIVLAIVCFAGCKTTNGPIGSNTVTALEATPKSMAKSVTVKRNDTLNTIARANKTDWQSIVMLNRQTLVNGLREGQVLKVIPGRSAQGFLAANDAKDQSSIYEEDGADEDLKFLQKRKRGLLNNGPKDANDMDMVYPVEGRISSHFGKRGRRMHKGIDLVANVGTPIVAAADGEVIFSGRQRGYGSTIVVDHGQFMTLYAHASKLIAHIGDRVKQGDFVARVGRTGNARGAHLHFEVRNSDNIAIDPEPYLHHKTIAISDIRIQRELAINLEIPSVDLYAMKSKM